MFLPKPMAMEISYTILAPAIAKREADPKKSSAGVLEAIQLDTELFRLGHNKACLYPYTSSLYTQKKRVWCFSFISFSSHSLSFFTLWLGLNSCVVVFETRKGICIPPFKVSIWKRVCLLLYILHKQDSCWM